jgi:hypothetical protein
MAHRTFLPWLLLGLLAGCGARSDLDRAERAARDASAPDAGQPPTDGGADAAPRDAGTPDAGAPDAGPSDAGALDAGPPDGGPDAGTPDGGEVVCNGLDDDADGAVDEGSGLVPVGAPAVLSPASPAERGNGDVWRTPDGFHATWWITDPDGATRLEHVALDPDGRPLGPPQPYPALSAARGPGPRAHAAGSGRRLLAYCRRGAPTRAVARIGPDADVLAPLALAPTGLEGGDEPCGAQAPVATAFGARDALLWATDRARLLVGPRPGAPAALHAFDGTSAPDARPTLALGPAGGWVAHPVERADGGVCLAVDRVDAEGTPGPRAGCFEPTEPGARFRNAAAIRTPAGQTLFFIGLEETTGAYVLRVADDGRIDLPLRRMDFPDWNRDPVLVRTESGAYVYAISACVVPSCNVKLFATNPDGDILDGETQDAPDEGYLAQPRLAPFGDRVLMTYYHRLPGDGIDKEIRSVVYRCVPEDD